MIKESFQRVPSPEIELGKSLTIFMAREDIALAFLTTFLEDSVITIRATLVGHEEEVLGHWFGPAMPFASLTPENLKISSSVKTEAMASPSRELLLQAQNTAAAGS